MYKDKNCIICGVLFTPTSSTQKCCNRKIVQTCAICGKSFDTICKLSSPKCCSPECTKIYAKQQAVISHMKNTRICILCGKPFAPVNNTQRVCMDTHYRNCVICGKQFEILRNKIRNLDEIAKTCSPECKTKASFANGNPFSRIECREKAKQTMKDRYGVEHPMHSEAIKAKVDDTNQNRYGAKRFVQTDAYIDKAVATNQEKYGTDWARQNPDIQKKSEDTLYEHFGITNPMQSDEFKSKIKETYKERTGYDSPMHNPDVLQKLKDTYLDKYGVENPMQDPKIRAKATDTMLDRYGVPNALQSETIKAKVRETNKIRYGYDVPAKSPVVQAKIADTMMKRHGVAHYNESWEYRESVMTDPSKLNEWKAFLENPEEYINTHFDHKPNFKELEDMLGVNDSSIGSHLARQGKLDLLQYTLSYAENELVDILKSIKPDIQINRHNRSIIAPYEIDVYLPEYHIGIEMNPTSTHNSSFGTHNNRPTPPSYHKMKTNMCEEKGVFLFHIFGYEWSHKKPIIISMLRNLIGCNTEKVYARQCEIREVPGKVAFEFLQANHRQGGVHSKIRYGLYYKDELVSLMTFGKLRNTMGLGNEDLSDCWELVRFCNRLDTSVIGGASRLFKHFIRAYNPERIRSFSDRSHTRGTMYVTLGFVEINRSSEQYVWVNTDNNKAYNRVNAQKHNLKKFFHDDTIDLTKTEREIMESHGYAQVYDSGTITWEWASQSL